MLFRPHGAAERSRKLKAVSDDTKHPIDADAAGSAHRRIPCRPQKRCGKNAAGLELQPTGPPNEEWRNFIDSAGNIRTAGNLTKFTAIRPRLGRTSADLVAERCDEAIRPDSGEKRKRAACA